MKVYLVDISLEKTKLYLKTMQKTIQAFFKIEQVRPFIYNSCQFSYDLEDIIITPTIIPYDDSHENIFIHDLTFAGHSYNLIERIEKFIRYIISIIDDINYEIIFLFASDIISFSQTGLLHHIIEEILKEYDKVKYLATFNHEAIKQASLAFIASFNDDNYLYANDDNFFISSNKRNMLSHRGDSRYEDSMNDFAEEMKYNLGLNDLTKQQINKIFFRAHHQYQQNQATDIVVKTKDREIVVTVNEIKSRFENGKKRFQTFIERNVTKNKFTCYLEFESKDIETYTIELLTKYLNNIQLVIVDNTFYDYFFSYCLLVIMYHDGAKSTLTRKKYNQKERRGPFDGKHVYYIYQLYTNNELIKNLPCHCLEKFINCKKIVA